MSAVARTSVLITGFGPFPGVPDNATMHLVPEIAAHGVRVFRDLRIVTDILPTEWQAAPERLEALVRAHDPDLALHFGVSARATGFELERIGYNACSGADAAGRVPKFGVLAPGGPESFTVDLPLAAIVERLRRRGIDAHLSRDAGRYLCNALLYHSIASGRGQGRAMRSLFVHVPAALPFDHRSMRGRYRACRLNWATALRGGIEILAACLGRSSPRMLITAVARR